MKRVSQPRVLTAPSGHGSVSAMSNACESTEPRAGARKGERGFALLLVFLMAAAVAIMLYSQIPRVAFESEREKEQLLISRGEQYKRAIQMYVVAYKKYPAKIEDLENTNNKRYLRKRYIDPMTGKDEWRLVHANGAGQLTDSLVTKPPAPGTGGALNASNASNASGATGASGASGATGADGPPEVNLAVLRQQQRDRALVAANGGPGSQQQQNIDPNDPRYWPAITLTPSGATGANGQPLFPGQQFPVQQFPGQQLPVQQGQLPYPGQQLPGQQGQPPPFPGQQLPGQGQLSSFPGQQLPGQPGFQPGLPGQQVLSQLTPGLQSGQPGGFPNLPGQGINPMGLQGAQTPGTPSNPATTLINNLLTTPRTDPGASTNNSGAAGGLVGVASNYKGASIKVYKDRQKYQEWEFIFDMKTGLPGQQGQQNRQQQPGGPLQPGTGATPQTPQNPTGGPTPPQP